MALKKSKKYESLRTDKLKLVCSPEHLDFANTGSVKPVEGIIGQERALKAIKLGVEIKAKGYNIFISGLSGTGKATTVKKVLETLAPDNNELYDYAYVNNFKDEDSPRLLIFKAGDSSKFSHELDSSLRFLQNNIPKVLESDQFLARKKKLIDRFNHQQGELRNGFQEKLAKENFTLGQIQAGETQHPEVMPVINNQPVMMQQLDDLVKSEAITGKKAQELTEKYTAFRQDLQKVFRKTMELKKKTEKEIIELEVDSVDHLLEVTIDSLKENFNYPDVHSHLDEMRIDILENLDVFKSGGVQQQGNEENLIIDYLKPYEVNIILDNGNSKGVPVIVESTPSFTNIFGTIDKYNDGRGGWFADFSCIKAGSLLKANGGFLVVNAMDAFSEPGVWKALKRAMMFEKLEITDAGGGPYAPVAMKPEAIKINTKIIFIGNSYIYSVLSESEDDFNKIFKIKAEFDYEIKRTNHSENEYSRIVKKLVEEENLPEFDKSAIAKIIEYGARYAGTQNKLTTRFAYITDLAREAAFWAKDNGADVVSEYHVKQSYEAARERHGLYESKMKEMYLTGDILVDTSGSKTGQINGLAVYGSDRYSFGKPVRITASASLGKGDIINVEREAGLSGNTHNKGLLIISGYFREKFGKRFPLSFTSSIVFEQGYGPIDGDSASVTEICALISALSGVPIKQNFAITGSVNQKGDIQPIGGVNEKIEGFFQVCSEKGLTGDQGVIIPEQNVKDLMLNDEVTEAVKEGKFAIYPVSTVEEALEILTGYCAVEFNKNGTYSKNSVFGLMETQLLEMKKLSAREKNDK